MFAQMPSRLHFILEIFLLGVGEWACPKTSPTHHTHSWIRPRHGSVNCILQIAQFPCQQWIDYWDFSNESHIQNRFIRIQHTPKWDQTLVPSVALYQKSHKKNWHSARMHREKSPEKHGFSVTRGRGSILKLDSIVC